MSGVLHLYTGHFFVLPDKRNKEAPTRAPVAVKLTSETVNPFRQFGRTPF